ncbi:MULTISPECIES: TorF family putative porin [Marichromatium]|uniref:Uncharacterized protein (TIGR02001 family) n=1 Tax=Marichromatium gracile TaxID=1048 RepID=A0A4R4AII0_MARGR|nr:MULTISPECIES: TorF family putative porin [Marichromatium]MBO8087279.1 hypothetical protein [Marichromatium sp.]MBK1708335.1 hypothetical protein [Marichromatium gracile]RNE91175.1 hypothetical protein EBL84_03920 [Marichromatium sp. AB31]RNE93026.1 hypothetical protein EBL85_09255 [Marichromatium sp. AB32]TCW38536.1 uncharacterized protein (TIGR02001 family) [Marichromatium gracile]
MQKQDNDTIKHAALAAVLGATLAGPAHADWSATFTGVSDYLFNGVTQTGHKPALQASLDWAGESGIYGGAWASNVDFDDDTHVEFDTYLGYATEFDTGISLDTGVAVYTYHGATHSSDGNYPEAYVKLGYAGFNLNVWYTYDYFGLDVGHVVVMLRKDLQINDDWSVSAWVDRSTSLDSDRFAWDEGEDSYLHWQVMANRSWQDFDFSLGVSGTDLSYAAGDTRVLFSVSRSFAL